jgi:hypothetical protein
MTSKREEADELLRLGASELDMVMNIGALKSGNRKLVEQDIRAVVEVAHDAGALVKVILETCLLTLEEKILASELAIAAGADFPENEHRIFDRRRQPSMTWVCCAEWPAAAARSRPPAAFAAWLMLGR